MLRTSLLLCSLSLSTGAYLSQLDAFADDSIRVRVAPPGGSITEPGLQALLMGDERPVTHTAVSLGADGSLTNGNLRVSVDPATGFISAVRVSDGAALLTQTALTWGAPDVPVSREGSVSVAVTFAGRAGEKAYGFGEHRTGTVQQLPFKKRFADSQDYAVSHGGDVSIPWYASSIGYGFVWNSAAYGSVDASEAGISWTSNATLGVDVWITTTSGDFDPASGRSPYANLLSNYVDAVGHASTMPFYSTGFVQCKDRYRNQTQLLDVARGYFERQLPVSVIVIDWKHWTAQGDWHFNPACWPDPQGMVDELATMGIELMVTFWPFQSRGSRYFQEFVSNGWLVNQINATGPTSYDGGDQFLIDQTNPYVRTSVFDKFWEGYGSYGIKTVWIDAAEPEHMGADAEGSWRYLAGTDGEVGEAFIQQHARSFQEGFASKGIAPGDYFILPRHAWAGSWRYSAALWSGDIASTFEELAIQVKVVQGALMSGVALWTTDIGGYWNGDSTDPVFQELIVRWFQFGAFSPLFRLHGHRAGGPPDDPVCGGTNGDNEVWNLAKDAAHYDAIVAMMRLRESLRQHVSDLNAETAASGMPMVRPMFLEWPLDAGAAGADVEDQFMFGPNWLVAPVTTFGAASRSVYLPALNASAEWVYYFNLSSVGGGGGRVELPTPIGEFPLFFRRAVPVPPPLDLVNATSFFSAERGDTVLCLAASCFSDNAPGMPGGYAELAIEGVALAAGGGGSAVIGGITYRTIPLTLWFSTAHSDNFVSSNSTPPDSSYAAITFADGAAFASPPPPGALPLQTWFKAGSGSAWDYATFASPATAAWVAARGYTNVTASVPIVAWVLPVGGA